MCVGVLCFVYVCVCVRACMVGFSVDLDPDLYICCVTAVAASLLEGPRDLWGVNHFKYSHRHPPKNDCVVNRQKKTCALFGGSNNSRNILIKSSQRHKHTHIRHFLFSWQEAAIHIKI